MVFASEEPRSKSNRLLNEIRQNHDIKYLNMDEWLDFWMPKRQMKSVMNTREEWDAITRKINIKLIA
jgi:hypothetical protein